MEFFKEGVQRFAWLKNYLPYSIGIVGNACLNIVFISLCTRLVTPHEYGRYSVGLTSGLLVSSFLAQWLFQATGRFLAGAPRAKAISVRFTAVISTSLLMALLCMISVVVYVFGEVELVSNGKLISAIIFCVATQIAFTTCTVILQAERKVWAFAGQQLSAGVLKILICGLAVSTIVAQAELLILGVGFAQLVGVLAGLRIGQVSIQRVSSLRFYSTLRGLLHYGLGMTIWFAFMNLSMYGDRLLISYLKGADAAGIYSAASSVVAGTVGLVTAPILAAAWPKLMAAWNQRRTAEVSVALGNIITLLVSAGIIMVGAIYTVAEPLAVALLGVEFHAAYRLMPLLASASTLFGIGTFIHKPLEFVRNKKIMIISAAVTALAAIVLNLVFIPSADYQIAAWVSNFAALLYCLLTAREGRKIVKWSLSLMPILLTALAVLLSGYIVAQLRFAIEPAHNLVTCIIELTLYVVCISIFGAAGYAVRNSMRFARVR